MKLDLIVLNIVVMYIETVKNRNSPPCILMRESYRENGKVKKRTVANITHLPSAIIAGLKKMLNAGDGEFTSGDFEIVRSLPHGHVLAVKSVMNTLGIAKLIASSPSSERDLILAMIAARILFPGSKLATSREFCSSTGSTTLGSEYGLDEIVSSDDLYAAMDWLLPRQGRIEKKLAAKHLDKGTMVLYDLTSSYVEGRCCNLAKRGHNRDGKEGKLQIEFGLLCNKEGCPVAVEVFEGNTADPMTVGAQVQKLRECFHLEKIVLVGDRGMLTEARIREELKPTAGIDWISALRGTAIKKLVDSGAVDRSLFDELDLARVTSPDYPGERLIVCRNPFLAERRARKRIELLTATEVKLDKIVRATARARKPLRGQDEIGIRVGKIINAHNVGKHFILEINDTSFAYRRNDEKISEESALDGLYVIRTSITDPEILSDEDAVSSYKSLTNVEAAFRCLKTVDLKVRPIYHYLDERVKAHILICMLAYYVEWHMRGTLKEFLFHDEFKQEAQKDRSSVVAPAKRSEAAKAKDASKLTTNGNPVHSFATMLRDLSTIVRSEIQPNVKGAGTYAKITRPTPLQEKILRSLDVKLA